MAEVQSGKSVFKAQKLLKVALDYAGDAVVSVKIRGDFFMHPDENLEKLEQQLRGALLERTALEERIRMFLRTTQVFGFDEKSLAEAVLMAAGKGTPPAPQ